MSVFDRVHFDMMTAGDRQLQAEVLGLFRSQVAGWRLAIAPSGDWRTAVHTLKGSARGIGLQDLAAACEAAENAADEAALAQVQAALSEALTALEQFVAAAGQGR